MAFQCKQPCLPPPGCPLEASDSGPPQCPASSASYQAKQPCALPPGYAQPGAPEALPSYYAPTSYGSPCGAAAPSPASPCAAPAQPTAFVAEVAPAPAPAPAAVCTGAAAEACPSPPAEPLLSYVMPGSTVRLNPSGALSVEPGAPADAGSVFVEAYTPHYL